MVLHPSGTLLPLTAKGGRGARTLHKRVAGLIGDKRQQGPHRRGGLPPFGDILRVLKALTCCRPSSF
jgi:hypothetical protein